MKRPLIPPPTRFDDKGRPRTKWDDLAEKEPPRRAPRTLSDISIPTPCRGLSDHLPLPGMPPFTKCFKK